MGLIAGFSRLTRVARLPTLRIGASILCHLARDGDPWSLVPESSLPQASIGELGLPLTCGVVRKGAIGEPAPQIDLEHAGPWGFVSGLSDVSDVRSDKLRFGNADILTTKLRPYLGKTILNEYDGAIGTTEWIPLRINAERMRPKLLFYLMQTSRYKDLAGLFMSGKEHPRISPDMLARLRVPLPEIDAQDALIAELDAMDGEARTLEERVGSPQRVVSLAFESRFGLSLSELAAAREKTVDSLRLIDCASNRDARFSFRFHCPSGKFAEARLLALTSKRLRDFVREPIVLGSSVSPSDYEDGTGKLYASMATIKCWVFDPASANEVSETYAAANAAKAFAEGDIIMARSGEGTIGKLALIGPDVEGICADFTMRIRVDESRLLSAFARYYLMSDYLQHLVYTHKKGLGNNTNIFPVQLQNFPMLELSIEEQKAAVRELDDEIDRFESKKAQIEALREAMERRIIAGLS